MAQINRFIRLTIRNQAILIFKEGSTRSSELELLGSPEMGDFHVDVKFDDPVQASTQTIYLSLPDMDDRISVEIRSDMACSTAPTFQHLHLKPSSPEGRGKLVQYLQSYASRLK